MMISKFNWGSENYKKAVSLRDKVLRKPLGMKFSDEDLAKEKDFEHFGIFDDNGEIIAVLYIKPIGDNTIQLKQMAVDFDYHNQGYGRKLVEYVMNFYSLKGIDLIILHARKEAVGFYEKLNFVIEGDKFYEIGIEHYKMIKKIKKTY
ncbi:MAG: GNAT family N-acetyltransferase [Saprospiraceae bacterium]